MHHPLRLNRGSLGPFWTGWDDMHDMEAGGLQFAEQHWQCFGCTFMNIMQQQYPSPFSPKPVQAALNHLIR